MKNLNKVWLIIKYIYKNHRDTKLKLFLCDLFSLLLGQFCIYKQVPLNTDYVVAQFIFCSNLGASHHQHFIPYSTSSVYLHIAIPLLHRVFQPVSSLS